MSVSPVASPAIPERAYRIQTRTETPRVIQALTQKGYLVVPPIERQAAKVSAPGQTIHQRILMTFYRRMRMAQQQGGETGVQGLTDAELSHLMGYEDLHRRTAELRACGLLTQEVEGERMRRKFRGARGLVSFITPAGVAALRVLERESKPEPAKGH